MWWKRPCFARQFRACLVYFWWMIFELMSYNWAQHRFFLENKSLSLHFSFNMTVSAGSKLQNWPTGPLLRFVRPLYHLTGIGLNILFFLLSVASILLVWADPVRPHGHKHFFCSWQKHEHSAYHLIVPLKNQYCKQQISLRVPGVSKPTGMTHGITGALAEQQTPEVVSGFHRNQSLQACGGQHSEPKWEGWRGKGEGH